MRKEKAIKILDDQIEKIKLKEGQTVAWETSTKAYIELFFGKESIQYESFKHFNFASEYTYDPIPFLTECKMQIKNVGVFKKSKRNFISSISNVTLLSIFFPIMVVVFSVGFYFGTEKINGDFIKTERELIILKDSLSISKIILSADTSKSKSNEPNTRTNN